jgi:autotransporter-associated beta strand protein
VSFHLGSNNVVTLNKQSDYTSGFTYLQPLLGAGTGELRLGTNNAMSGNTVVEMQNAAGYTLTLNLNNNNQTLKHLQSTAGATAANTKVSLGSGTLTVGDASNRTFGGEISGSGGVVKTGSGSWTLTAANTYSGGTVISNGTLQIGAGGTSGSVLGSITNNAALVFNRSDDLTQSTVISGSGSLTKSGNGTLTLSGASANTYSGLTSINAGTLNLNKSSGTEAIAGNITLSASGATLLLSASGQVADASIVTLSGGTIRRGGNVSEVFGNLNVSAPSFLDFGAGNAAGTLSFGTYTQSALLTVQNFLPGNKLQFASGFNTALLPTSGNLSNANFSFSNGFTTGTEGGYFTITAIPEPSTVWCALGLFALFGTSSWLRWQRRTFCAAPRANFRS